MERGELIRKQNEATKRQGGIYERLRAARAAARLSRFLPYHNGRPGLSMSTPGQLYQHPNEGERRQASRECYWCGECNMLYGHHGRDCQHPHVRCARLSRGRCVVPSHHAEYHSPPPSTRVNAPTMAVMTACFYAGTTPEDRGRLGKGPDNGQDSLPRWLGRQTGERERVITPQSGKRPDEDRDTSTRWLERRGPEWTLGEAGSVTETETGQRVGGGVDRLNDSRLNFRSRLGPRPSTGGDVTILTPFSISPMTDASVDALPTLFLAYCALDHADSDHAD